MEDTTTLPYGAKGIEAGDIVLEHGKDKIVMLAKSSGDHYTLQAGTQSGIIDLHRTWRDDNGVTHHEAVFAMHHEQLTDFLATFATAPGELRKLLRPLRVGWLARQGIGIMYGLDPTTDEQIAAVTRRRKKRLVLDEQQWQAAINVPAYLEDVYQFPDGAFSLFAGKRKIGIGLKKTDEHGRTHLYWLRLRDLRRLAIVWERRLTQAVQQHAIPQAEYHHYSILQTPPNTECQDKPRESSGVATNCG